MKKIRYGVMVVVLIAMMGAQSTVLHATSVPKEKDADVSVEPENRRSDDEIKRICEQWDALSKEQKDKVYDLFDQKLKIENAIVDQLASLGLMTQNEADEMKSHMEEQTKSMRDNQEFPFRRMTRRANPNKSNK